MDVAPLGFVGPVGDEQNAALARRRQHVVDQMVGDVHVEPAGGLVEHQQPTAGEQRPRHRQAPPLTPRDGDPVLADRRIEAGGEGGHPGAELGRIESRGHLVVRGVGATQRHVGADAPGEQLGPLVDQGAGLPDLCLRHVLDRDPVQRHVPSLEGPEAEERVDQARLSRPARTGDGDPCSGRQSQRHLVEGAGKLGCIAQRRLREADLGGAGLEMGDRRGVGDRDGNRVEGKQAAGRGAD